MKKLLTALMIFSLFGCATIFSSDIFIPLLTYYIYCVGSYIDSIVRIGSRLLFCSWNGNIIDFAKEMKVDDVIFINNLSMIGSNYLISKLSALI